MRLEGDLGAGANLSHRAIIPRLNERVNRKHPPTLEAAFMPTGGCAA